MSNGRCFLRKGRTPMQSQNARLTTLLVVGLFLTEVGRGVGHASGDPPNEANRAGPARPAPAAPPVAAKGRIAGFQTPQDCAGRIPERLAGQRPGVARRGHPASRPGRGGSRDQGHRAGPTFLCRGLLTSPPERTAGLHTTALLAADAGGDLRSRRRRGRETRAEQTILQPDCVMHCT